MHFRHIAIRVKDIDASIKFYEEIPELTVARRQKVEGGEIAFLSNCEGETQIELVCLAQGATFEGKGMFICFEASEEKLAEKHILATERGLKPSPIQEPGDGTKYFYVYDPDGVSVQLRSF